VSGSSAVWVTVKKQWRGWLRAFHRDMGYLAVGLTLIYAVSGLAINHIDDWDPNFVSYERERKIAPIPAEVPDDQALAQAREALDVGTPRSVYRAGDELHLEYDNKKLVIYGDSGHVVEQGREPRFFLRIANWLHYNRGKKAWTYVADFYAAMLLYLAISGIFMIKGRKGLKWRGAILLSLGALVPFSYVVWSGGPSAANRAAAAKAQRDAPTAEDAPTPDPAAAPPAATAPPADEFARPPVLREPPAPAPTPPPAP
jgi:hypothetical protein